MNVMPILDYLLFMQNHTTDKYIDNVLLSLFDNSRRDAWNRLDSGTQHKLADQFYQLLRTAFFDAPGYCEYIIEGFINSIEVEEEVDDTSVTTDTQEIDIFEEATTILNVLKDPQAQEDYFYCCDIFFNRLETLGIKEIWLEDLFFDERIVCIQNLSLMLHMALRLQDPLAIKDCYQSLAKLVCSFEASRNNT